MAPAHKGKAPTKGNKQIMEENSATIKFYRNMFLVSGFFYNFILFTLYYDSVTGLNILMNFVVTLIYVGCWQMMRSMTQQQQADYPVLDLNMEGGIGEHLKDIIILTSITHVLAILSNYFWLLLLLLPARVFYLVWTNILGPWFFQEGPEDTEMDEKKRKKLERKLNRIK